MKKTISMIFCGLLSLNAMGAEVTKEQDLLNKLSGSEILDVIALERKAEIAYEKKILGCEPININIKVVEYKGNEDEQEEINFDVCAGKDFEFHTEEKEDLPNRISNDSISDKLSDLRTAENLKRYEDLLDYNRLNIKLNMKYSDNYSFILISNEKRIGRYKINDHFNTIFPIKYNEDITLYENKKRAYILNMTKK